MVTSPYRSIAMNRFRIAPGREEDFLEVWRNCDSHLDEVPGFKKFKMLQGDKQDDHTVFISHSVWESEHAFRAWTQSEAFRNAHANAQ
ncbi:antibiotic biosynthesis monooxygenase family protein [Vreelandella sp. EE27]